MEVLLVSGYIHNYLKILIEIDGIKVNNNESIHIIDIVEEVSNMSSKVDCIIITDESIHGETTELRQIFKELFLCLESISNKVSVKLITRNLNNHNTFMSLANKNIYQSYLIEGIRFKKRDLYEILLAGQEIMDNNLNKLDEKMANHQSYSKVKTKKISFLKNMFIKTDIDNPIKAEDEISRRFSALSTNISRIIAITGHRGSGVTSTAVNIATEAVARGMSAIILDMDIHFRTINLYFSEFVSQGEIDEEVQSSLIRCLARPESYITNACPVRDKLWVIGLSYSFEEIALLDKFLASNYIIGLLLVLKQKFNLVIIDFPFDVLGKFPETLIYIDTFGLCVNNNYYSIINTLRKIGEEFNKEDIALLNTKSKLIATKYNEDSMCSGERFTPDKVCNVLSSISDLFINDIVLAGYVKYYPQFDCQIELDSPMVSQSSVYKEYYSNILLNLI